MPVGTVTRRSFVSGLAATALVAASCSRRPAKPKISVLYFAGLPEGQRLKDNLPAFAEASGIEVNFQELPYDYIRPRQLQSFRNRTADFDVVFVDDIWMYEYAHKGYVLELTDLVRRSNYDFDDMKPQVVDAEGKLDDKIWLIPQRADVQVLFYNRAIFEDDSVRRQVRRKLGRDLQVPASWEEYAETARALSGLKAPAGPVVGCAETLKRPHFAFEFFATRYWSFSGRHFLENGQPVFASPEGIAALEYLRSLRDVWAPGSLNAGHDETINAFVGGNVAMIPQWFAFYALLKQPGKGLGNTLGVDLMPGKRLEDGKVLRKPSIGGGSLGISANSVNRDEAWEFIKFMTSRKIMSEAALAGEIVTRQSAYKNPAVAERNPAVPIYLQSLEMSMFRPRSSNYAAIEAAIGEGVSRALAGETSAATALADASRAVAEFERNAS